MITTNNSLVMFSRGGCVIRTRTLQYNPFKRRSNKALRCFDVYARGEAFYVP